jgi:diguanylate cyclase (GGDEF)-like protein/PAS domain S-box-containing protein
MRRLVDRWWLVGLTLLVGVVALTAVVFRIESDRRAQQRQAVERAAVVELRDSVGDVLSHEVALARVLGVLHTPIGRRWPVFANIVTSQPLAHSVGFVTPVSQQGRAAFQARTGLQLVQFSPAGVYRVAQRRPQYFVLTHVLLKSGTTRLGLDLGANPVRRALLVAAAATGRQLATPPVPLLTSGHVEQGVVVFAQVRTARGHLRGWVSATYSAGQLAALVKAHTPGLRLTVRDGASTLVSAPGSVTGKPSFIGVAGRRWSVWASLPESGVGVVPWLVLGLGLSLTMVAVMVLRHAVARERYAVAQVARHVSLERERQAELDAERRALADAQAMAQVGSWSWTPATDTTEWSAEMYRIFGRDAAQGPAASDAFFAYLHPEDRERIVAGYAEAFGADEGFWLYYRIVVDDEIRYLHAIGRREDGGLYVGTVQDITPLRRVQDALIEAERANRTLAMIVQQSNDAVIAKTVPGGVITEWNQAAQRIYGYTSSEALGQPISMLVPADRAGEEGDIMRRLITGQAITNYETRRKCKDGALLDVSVTVSPIRDDDGQIVGASAISRDITERIALEHTLRETEARFRGAFEEAPIGMALLDLDGRLTQVNDAVCRILGYPSDELVGMTAASITHRDDLPADRQAWEEIRAGQRTSYATEKRYLHAAGHPVICMLQATVIAAADGHPSSVLAQVQDITERKHNEEQLEYLADHDALTGLLNRRAFARELASHAGLASRYGPEGTVLMIDLDQFKYVNDTNGHQAGDELIVRLGELLSDRLRTSDVLARLGGDEFAVLLPKADMDTAELVAQSILETLRDNAISIAGTRRKITASIGIASFEQGADLNGEDALINADLALYDAKAAGRDQASIFNPERPAAARMKGRITWGQQITAALETDNFTLLAQPIIDLATSTVSQYELLLRMNDEHGELIPPGAFLQVAERLDLIHDIDMWVVTHGIQALADLAPERPDIALEINLSGRSLSDQKLLEHIDAELRHTRVAPQRIIFEVTETAALTSLTKARAFGEHLSQIGCRFALDDFGGGLGSFYYLKHLVFDYLKIDGEFIRNALSDNTDRLLIKPSSTSPAAPVNRPSLNSSATTKPPACSPASASTTARATTSAYPHHSRSTSRTIRLRLRSGPARRLSCSEMDWDAGTRGDPDAVRTRQPARRLSPPIG